MMDHILSLSVDWRMTVWLFSIHLDLESSLTGKLFAEIDFVQAKAIREKVQMFMGQEFGDLLRQVEQHDLLFKYHQAVAWAYKRAAHSAKLNRTCHVSFMKIESESASEGHVPCLHSHSSVYLSLADVN